MTAKKRVAVVAISAVLGIASYYIPRSLMCGLFSGVLYFAIAISVKYMT